MMTMSSHLNQHETEKRVVSRCVWLVQLRAVPPPTPQEQRWRTGKIITKNHGKNNQFLFNLHFYNRVTKAPWPQFRTRKGSSRLMGRSRVEEVMGKKRKESQQQVLPLGRLLVLAPVVKDKHWWKVTLVILTGFIVKPHIYQTNERHWASSRTSQISRVAPDQVVQISLLN